MQQQSVIPTGQGPVPRLGDPDPFDRSYMPLPYQHTSLNQDLGVVGFRPSGISMKTPVTGQRNQSPASADEKPAARSRSRSAASENLLVSLDSCPPIANASAVGEVLGVERSISVGNFPHRSPLLGGPKLDASRSFSKEAGPLSAATTGPAGRLTSLTRGQHEKIQIRYSTK